MARSHDARGGGLRAARQRVRLLGPRGARLILRRGPPASGRGRPSRRTARILWGNLAWHQAVAAWREFARDAPTPECIEVLKKGERCAVYRLVGAGRGGAPIIAWCSRRTRALPLRTIYEKVVRRLSTRAPRFRAFRAGSTGFAWLFLEEVGGGGA